MGLMSKHIFEEFYGKYVKVLIQGRELMETDKSFLPLTLVFDSWKTKQIYLITLCWRGDYSVRKLCGDNKGRDGK